MFLKSKTIVAGLGILAMTTLGFGCGDDEKSGSSSGITSVNGDASLNSLSGEETSALCDDLGEYINNNLPDDTEENCNRSGFHAAVALQTDDIDSAIVACETARDTCLSMEATAQPDSDSGSTCTAPADTCEATVDEYVICLTTAFGIMDKTADSVPACDALTLSELESDLPPSPTSAEDMEALQRACAEINDTCPGWGVAVGADVD